MQYHPRYKTSDDPFGLLVLTLRKKAGLTQVEMAKLVGVTEKAVRNREGGTDCPSESHLTNCRLSDRFGEKQENRISLGKKIADLSHLFHIAISLYTKDPHFNPQLSEDISILGR